MKRLLTLVVAGCMVLGSLGTASAVDVKVKGQWWFHYGYYSNNNLAEKNDTGSHSDRVRARQRIRTQIQFIADENLSAMLNMEANMNWGSTATGVNAGGGAIDADSTTFVIKHAYLDWTIPNTQIKTRMGMQGLALPSVAFGNPVMDADVAAVTVSTQFTPEVGLTVFWARALDRSYTADQANGGNSFDDLDVFGFVLPVKTDVVRFSPWGAIALIGKDSGYFDNGAGLDVLPSGLGRGRPHVNTLANGKPDVDSESIAWWAGTTFELPILDPFFVKIDAMMGGLDTGDSDSETFGWLVAGNIGYKFSFGALSAIGWYASGDDDLDDRGTMPILSDDGGFKPTRYGTAGSYSRSWDRLITGNGVGTWGIGLRLADVSFVDNLKHTASVVWMGGTNSADNLSERRSVRNAVGDSRFGGQYLMSSDRAWEVNLLNEYKVNDNLKIGLDFAYVWLDLGEHWVDNDDTEGSFATMLGITYSF